MSIFLYNFFHNETNDRAEKGLIDIPKDINKWPETWKKIVYKHYSLFRPIHLEKEEGFLFKDLLYKRRSSDGYFLNNKLTLSKLSYMLRCGYGLQGCDKGENRGENRTVPSAGQRYPLELYIFLFKKIDECQQGVYHYDVKNHMLEPVIFTEFTPDDIRMFSSKESLQSASSMICITGIFSRTIEKYGSRGYRYILLEAGHVAQNILLAGTEKNVSILPIGAVNEEEIEKVVGLSSNERVVYTLFL